MDPRYASHRAFESAFSVQCSGEFGLRPPISRLPEQLLLFPIVWVEDRSECQTVK
jgi:hypothetical protein